LRRRSRQWQHRSDRRTRNLTFIVAPRGRPAVEACSCGCPIGAHRENESFLLTPDTGVQPPWFATLTILLAKWGAVHTGRRSVPRSLPDG
jgi:hypothetical protein